MTHQEAVLARVEVAKPQEGMSRSAQQDLVETVTRTNSQASNLPPNRSRRPVTGENPDSTAQKWPVVQFENGHTCLCPPSPFDVVNVFGRTEASRDQVPLIIAWAMSIHKAQGQTLGRVKVDLRRIFEKGQGTHRPFSPTSVS